MSTSTVLGSEVANFHFVVNDKHAVEGIITLAIEKPLRGHEMA